MYAVGDAHSHMSPVGDGGGEEELCHVRSGGRSVADVPSGGWERRGGSAMYAVGDTQWLMYPVGDGGGEEDLCHVRSGGHSLTYVSSGGWGRKGGSLPCTQWGTLSDTCTQWGMGEERRISAMYAVGDAQWLMYPVGDGGGEEDLCHVRSGGRSVADVPSGGWERRGGSLPCTQWGMLSDTCTQWGMGEEWRISAMYAVGDAQ